MAVRTPTTDLLKNRLTSSWAGLLNGDTGSPVDISRYNNAAITAKGTFGAGGTVTWQGSYDGGTTWAAFGAGITSTDTQIKALTPKTILVRPNITAGDGTTNVTAMLVASE